MDWKKRYRPSRRPAEREAFCRACDATIRKGEEMITWYSHRNRGQNIHICIDCGVVIGDIAIEG